MPLVAFGREDEERDADVRCWKEAEGEWMGGWVDGLRVARSQLPRRRKRGTILQL